MNQITKKWLVQIKKGYLDLCILSLIANKKQAYGFEIIQALGKENIELKDGTLYPLLNRMAKEGLLEAKWVIEDQNSKPRKYYTLTSNGELSLKEMQEEFGSLFQQYLNIKEKKYV